MERGAVAFASSLLWPTRLAGPEPNNGELTLDSQPRCRQVSGVARWSLAAATGVVDQPRVSERLRRLHSGRGFQVSVEALPREKQAPRPAGHGADAPPFHEGIHALDRGAQVGGRLRGGEVGAL